MKKAIDYIYRMIDADPISIVTGFFLVLWIVLLAAVILH